MGVKEFIVAICTALIIAEITAWLPKIIKKTINFSVLLLPKNMQERYREEWMADCNTIPGKLSQFAYSISLLCAAISIKFNCLNKEILVKRGLDLYTFYFASALLIPIFIPFMLYYIIKLRIEGQKGSIFYSELCVGQHGKPFKLWVLRTLDPNADYLLTERIHNDPLAREEWKTYGVLADDPRALTKTGRKLRANGDDKVFGLILCGLLGKVTLSGGLPITKFNPIQDYLSYRKSLVMPPSLYGKSFYWGSHLNVDDIEGVCADLSEEVEKWTLRKDMFYVRGKIFKEKNPNIAIAILIFLAALHIGFFLLIFV